MHEQQKHRRQTGYWAPGQPADWVEIAAEGGRLVRKDDDPDRIDQSALPTHAWGVLGADGVTTWCRDEDDADHALLHSSQVEHPACKVRARIDQVEIIGTDEQLHLPKAKRLRPSGITCIQDVPELEGMDPFSLEAINTLGRLADLRYGTRYRYDNIRDDEGRYLMWLNYDRPSETWIAAPDEILVVGAFVELSVFGYPSISPVSRVTDDAIYIRDVVYSHTLERNLVPGIHEVIEDDGELALVEVRHDQVAGGLHQLVTVEDYETAHARERDWRKP